jgi:hypothetical protein
VSAAAAPTRNVTNGLRDIGIGCLAPTDKAFYGYADSDFAGVIAALPISCENGEAILSISEKGWKVTEVADIPVKGRGGAGVGFHPFVGGEDALLSVSISVAGFVRGGKPVEPRSARRLRLREPAKT